MKSIISRNRFFFCSARRFLPTAVILSFYPHPCRQYTSLNLNLNKKSTFFPRRSNNLHQDSFQSYLKSSSISLSSTSSSDSPSINHGPSAVRSKKPLASDHKLQLLSFYHFVPIPQPESIRDLLFERLENIQGLRGTVYVAREGINAQFAVPIGNPLDTLLEIFGKGGCLPFDTFQSNPPNLGDVVGSNTPTFDKLIVRTRDYILRDGLTLNTENSEKSTSLDWSDSGIELDPSEWNEQLRRPNIQLLDCRNDYESNLGTFVAATPLKTNSFSETWSILDSRVQSQSINPTEPVYIFCTGGIRCVKVGAYLRQQLGVTDVRSLRHGIIGYERWKQEAADEQNDKDSLWVGENFLFDKRRFAKDDDEAGAPVEPEPE